MGVAQTENLGGGGGGGGAHAPGAVLVPMPMTKAHYHVQRHTTAIVYVFCVRS